MSYSALLTAQKELPWWSKDVPESQWRQLAHQMARPLTSGELIRASLATPFTHIDGYMNRYWVANPFPGENRCEALGSYRDGLASVRVHHILRADFDRYLHDHPWAARTIILYGWYREVRLVDGVEVEFLRQPGDTATINFGEYHRIIEVSPGGVWTLFITWQYQGTWGFLVDGVKIPYRTYFNLEKT